MRYNIVKRYYIAAESGLKPFGVALPRKNEYRRRTARNHVRFKQKEAVPDVKRITVYKIHPHYGAYGIQIIYGVDGGYYSAMGAAKLKLSTVFKINHDLEPFVRNLL